MNGAATLGRGSNDMRPSFKFATLGGCAALMILQGCALHARRIWTPQPVPAQRAEIFYATDRTVTNAGEKSCPAGERSTGPAFGLDRDLDGSLRFGRFDIEVPQNHHLGELIPYKPLPECTTEASLPIYLNGPQPLASEDFWKSLNDSLQRASSKQILVFIHGYNFGFDEAALWAAQLRADLKFDGPLILYSWPSHGARLDYLADEESVAWSAPHLTQFLLELAARVPGAEIQFLAHSMGNRAIVTALDQIAVDHCSPPVHLFGQLVFAAPDIDSDVFRQSVPHILPCVEHATLYVSAKDQALSASARLHQYPRAGHSEFDLVVLPGMDTVDVTLVDETKYHHDYFLQDRNVLVDLFQVLREDLPASQRFGLYHTAEKNDLHWRLQP